MSSTSNDFFNVSTNAHTHAAPPYATQSVPQPYLQQPIIPQQYSMIQSAYGDFTPAHYSFYPMWNSNKRYPSPFRLYLCGVLITSLVFALVVIGSSLIITNRKIAQMANYTYTGDTIQGLDASTISVNSSNTPLGVQDIVKHVLPSVVSLLIGNNTFESGVIFDNQGDIITTNDAIQKGNSPSIQVVYSDYTIGTAKLIGTDPYIDIAVVKVNQKDLPPITIGKSSSIAVGQQVLTVSSPDNLSDSVTSGIVSALNRSYMVMEQDPPLPCIQEIVHDTYGNYFPVKYACYNVIQTDAGINPGSFGGALVDTNGALLGIASHNNIVPGNEHIRRDGEIESRNARINYALPVDESIRIARLIAAGDTVRHSRFGASIKILGTVQQEEKGAEVMDIIPGSNADHLGLIPGARILKLNGNEIFKSTQVPYILENLLIGDKASIEFELLSGKIITASTTIR